MIHGAPQRDTCRTLEANLEDGKPESQLTEGTDYRDVAAQIFAQLLTKYGHENDGASGKIK